MLKTESFSAVLRPEEHERSLPITVPAERRLEQSRLELRFSPTLAGAMLEALPYLASYPYGCTEQTLNRFLPSVIAEQSLRRLGVKLEDIRKKSSNLNAQELGDPAERAAQWRRWDGNPVFDEAELRRMVNAGVKQLAEMQVSDGGWGWFSGHGERSYPHTTAYVVHGLQVARENGVQLPGNLLERGLGWLEHYRAAELQELKNAAQKIEPRKDKSDDLDAFVEMVLQDAGKGSPEMADFLFRDKNDLSVYAKAMFGLALSSSGQQKRLTELLRNIEQYLVKDAENQTAYLKLEDRWHWWYWYGSEIESDAYYLKLLSRTNPKSEAAAGLVKYLLNNRKHSTYWNSTRDTSLVVEAFADYLKATGEAEPDMTVTVRLDGKELKRVKITKDNLFSFDGTVVLTGAEVASGRHTVTFEKTGKGPLYANAYLTNFTLEDFITRAGLEVKVTRAFYKLEREAQSARTAGSRGQAVEINVEKHRRVPIESGAALKSGDLVEIELSIESKNDYEYLVFEDMKAAGFEPVDLRSGYTRNALGAYVEFRDNRAAFFVRALPRGKHSVAYRLRAEIPGLFSALPARGYAMYAPELRGNSDELKVGIVE